MGKNHAQKDLKNQMNKAKVPSKNLIKTHKKKGEAVQKLPPIPKKSKTRSP
jgi:hypothetical protein